MTNSVLLAMAVAYAVTFAGLTVWLRSVRPDLRRYCYPVLAIVGVAGIFYTLEGLGVGTVVIEGEPWNPLGRVEHMFSMTAIVAGACLLAGVQRKYTILIVLASLTNVVGFQLPVLMGGAIAAVGFLVALGCMFVIFWILLGPAWRAAKQQSDHHRLLYWKLRNLIVFILVMVTVSAATTLGLFTEFISTALLEYMNFLLRAGFAVFVFANVDALDSTDFDFDFARFELSSIHKRGV